MKCIQLYFLLICNLSLPVSSATKKLSFADWTKIKTQLADTDSEQRLGAIQQISRNPEPASIKLLQERVRFELNPEIIHAIFNILNQHAPNQQSFRPIFYVLKQTKHGSIAHHAIQILYTINSKRLKNLIGLLTKKSHYHSLWIVFIEALPTLRKNDIDWLIKIYKSNVIGKTWISYSIKQEAAIFDLLRSKMANKDIKRLLANNNYYNKYWLTRYIQSRARQQSIKQYPVSFFMQLPEDRQRLWLNRYNTYHPYLLKQPRLIIGSNSSALKQWFIEYIYRNRLYTKKRYLTYLEKIIDSGNDKLITWYWFKVLSKFLPDKKIKTFFDQSPLGRKVYHTCQLKNSWGEVCFFIPLATQEPPPQEIWKVLSNRAIIQTYYLYSQELVSKYLLQADWFLHWLLKQDKPILFDALYKASLFFTKKETYERMKRIPQVTNGQNKLFIKIYTENYLLSNL